MESESLSPKEFLKARRPERFSDSVVEEISTLDRSILEYHLDTLTSRSQETQFASFAKHLIEREVCPNILPQTGPTGGGDSKVDAETYPVSDQLSSCWYLGIGREAASERWAFAFSTKKEWRGKVRSDIAKLASTGRGYAKAFFVSSQFIADKQRGILEDELSKTHNLDVRILDRTWILDRVFAAGHQELAIEYLGLTPSLQREVSRGPLDSKREKDLEALEARIESALREGRRGIQLVDDCTESALLARGLERPRLEVEGRFLRAERLAKESGNLYQQIDIAYERAWTAYWWHEDLDLLASIYSEVEKLVKDSDNVHHLELLSNLWLLLRGELSRGNISEASISFPERTSILTRGLQRLAQEKERPSTSLQAQTLILQMRLSAASSLENVENELRGLKEIVLCCEGLVGYPLDPLAQVVTEIGPMIGDCAVYDDLFETIVEITSKRKGEVFAARMLLGRGAQKLEANRFYDAIKLLGKALSRLYKHESRDDLVRALYLCGQAYGRAGLPWAARGTLLSAASVAMNDFWTYADVTPLQAACLNGLKWLELQLARFPHVLAWYQVDRLIKTELVERQPNEDRLLDEQHQFDTCLGLLFLRSGYEPIKLLSKFPDLLDKLGLNLAAIALRYILGHEDGIPQELLEGFRTPQEFFLMWRDQPAAEELSSSISIYDGNTISLTSTVLGCRVAVECTDVSPCVEVAESLLAALESLLATSVLEGIMALEPILTIDIRSSGSPEELLAFRMMERTGRPHMEINCNSFDPHRIGLAEQAQLRNKLLGLLAEILPRVFVIMNPKQVLERLCQDELAIDRALNFTSSFLVLANVLGREPKTRLSRWETSDLHAYEIHRSEPWDGTDGRSASESTSEAEVTEVTFAQAEPPRELRDPHGTTHSQISTISLIRNSLWDRALWYGTAFLYTTSYSDPPILALLFKDAEAAEEIFSGWQQDLGISDSAERLRVVIIRHFNKRNPDWYRVIIGSNLTPEVARQKSGYMVLTSRIHTMEASSDRNLCLFLERYSRAGRFIVTHGTLQGLPSDPALGRSYIIVNRLHVREAADIGRYDMDRIGIDAEDDPIIPSTQSDAPVLDLLRHLKIERSEPRGQTSSS